MEYTDIVQLVAIYLGYFAGVFALSAGAFALWMFFSELAAPDLTLE